MRIKTSKAATRCDAELMVQLLAEHCACGLEIGAVTQIRRQNQGQMISHIIARGPRAESLLRWAAALNLRHDANIYIRQGSAAAHPWLFFDDLDRATSVKIAQKYAAIIIETSPGSYQCRLLADSDLDEEERTSIQRELVGRLHGAGRSADPGSMSGDHWGRLPGFAQRKPGPGYGHMTTITMHSIGAAPPLVADLYLLLRGNHTPPGGGAVSSSSAFAPDSVSGSGSFGRPDESKKEFAYAGHAYRRGVPREEIERNIAERALTRGKYRDPAKAAKYAEMTVSKAIDWVQRHGNIIV